MARLWTSGAEVSLVTTGPDGNPQGGNVPTRDTGTKRTGNASYKSDTGAGSADSYMSTPTALWSAVAGKIVYFRAYFLFTALPSANGFIATIGAASVRVTTAGKLQLINFPATQIGSDSVDTIATSQWYRIELALTYDGTATSFSAAELRMDGTTVASSSGLSLTVDTAANWGWPVSPAANSVVYADDVAVNDSTGAANNTWPGSGKVIMMCPISDNNRGAWTQGAGAGGTTNLWDAVNNTPPVGVADASATATTQIKNRTTTNPSNYDGNLDTYTNAGVGTADTVNSIQVWTVTGEDPATGTKAGTVSMVSNPAIGTASFNFGNDAGTQGTYLGLWFWSKTAISEAPSVTKGSAPVIRITCTSGATAARSASCCFLGAYVDYTPGATGSLLPGNTPVQSLVSALYRM